MRRLAIQIWEEVSPDVVLLPFGLLEPDEPVKQVDLKPGWRPSSNQPLIEASTVVGAGGHPLDLGSWDRVRYVGALLSVGFRPPVSVPVSSARAARILHSWERAEAEFDQVVKARAVGYGRSQADSVIAHVKDLWRQASRAAGMDPPTGVDAASPTRPAD